MERAGCATPALGGTIPSFSAGAMAEATPPPQDLVTGLAATTDIASLVCAGHSGHLNRTKRLKFIVSQAAGAAGHETVEDSTCRVLLGELKASSVDVPSYRWTTATAGAARLGAEGALDAAWVASTEAAVKAAESKCSAAPISVAQFRAEHGDADGALQALRKVKERQTDASVAMVSLPIIFGADLTKATIRSFAKDACARLLKSPLIDQLEPSAQAQVLVCDALVALSNRDYAGAARKFTAISAVEMPDDGLPGVVLPREVGLYGTLCALAALERAELQKQLLHSSTFLPFVEGNPTVLGMAADFHAGAYANVLKQLEGLQTTMYYDVHLASHREVLTEKIRTHCFTHYVRPFGRLDLAKMAKVFDMDLGSLESVSIAVKRTARSCVAAWAHLSAACCLAPQEIADLVLEKKIDGRIDSAQKQLVATVASRRVTTYNKALDEGAASLAASRQNILRANLAAKNFLSQPKSVAPPMGSMMGRDAEEQMQLDAALAASKIER